MKIFWDFKTFTVGPIDTRRMKPEHRAIMRLLENLKSGEKIHQREIAVAEPWLGCHPKWEGKLELRNPNATTLRKVRGDINEMRCEHHLPILSQPSKHGGYWYAQEDNEEDIDDFMEDLQATAIAQALSHLDTRDQMKVVFKYKVFRMESDFFFEKLREFLKQFEKPKEQPPPPKKPKKKKPPEDGGQGELGL